MNVFFLSDEKFAEIFAVALESLYTQQVNTKELRVFLIEDHLSEDSKSKIFSIAEKYGRVIEFIPMPDIESLIGQEMYIPHTLSMVDFARLFAADILPKDIDRAIELDCDIIVRHPLDDLWDFNLGEDYCAMINEGHSARMRQVLHISGDGMYYNSGVVLIDLKKWREKNVGMRSVRYIQKMHGYVPVNAQGVMNAVMDKHIALLPLKFNVYSLMYAFTYEEFLKLRCPTYYYSKKEYESALADPFIVHYMTCFYLDARPWMKGCLHPMTNDYLYYKSLTPWADAPLWEPASKMIRRAYSKFCHIIPKNAAVKISSFIYVDLIPARHVYMENKYAKLDKKTKKSDYGTTEGNANLSKRMKSFYEKFSFKNVNGEASGLITLTQEQLDNLHKVTLGIMDDIFAVCQDNHLICMLSSGTALGALRHQGFIPWDDDVDLNMTRASFKKFIPIFREKYGNKYWIHTPEDNPQYGMLICRILKKGTKVKSREDLMDDSEAGAYVDIFIIENIPNNIILRNIHGLACMASKICMSCRRFYRDRKWMMKAMSYNEDLKMVSRMRLAIGFLCSFLSVETWTKLTNWLCSLCKNNQSEYVNIPAGRWHYFGEIYKRRSFCKTKNVSFEGRQWPVCIGISEYMEQLYGDDYMSLPPIEKREKHIFWEFDLGESN